MRLLRETYCGAIGIEFMHIQAPDRKEWIKKTLETIRSTKEYTKGEKIEIFKKLVKAETLENFLHTKFVGHKRFSLEGSESLIALLDKLFNNAAESGLNSIVLGMAHRGRLNVLVNNIGKSAAALFDEFDEKIDSVSYQGSGDVKYHLGSRDAWPNGFAIGEWSHVALTWEPRIQRAQLFVNGVDAKRATDFPTTIMTTNDPLLIG